MSVTIRHPDGSTSGYTGLPSLSDLMMVQCGDDKKHKIVFVDGNPTIVDRKPRKRKRSRL